MRIIYKREAIEEQMFNVDLIIDIPEEADLYSIVEAVVDVMMLQGYHPNTIANALDCHSENIEDKYIKDTK